MTVTMVAIFAAYETLKTILLPHLSIIGSHIITVIVIGFSSFLISRYTLSKYNEALAESQHRARIINETNRLLTTVLANLKEGVLVVNRQREIVLYNRSASGMLNLPADGGATSAGPPGWFSTDDKHAGKGRPRLVEATRNPSINEAFRRALEDGASTDERIELYGPETHSYRVGVAPLPVGLAVGVFYDITELERLEKVRREFFANLSHELRTPLTAILAFSETLLHGAIDDRENNLRFIEKLHKHAVRMSLLISDISDLSAIESGAVRLSIASVKLSESITEIIGLVEQAAVRRGVRIEKRIPDGLIVQADAKRLGQILHNLVDNAVKFNHDGGRVTISAKTVDGMVEIAVSDTGVGIADADLPRIFERLYRTDRSRSREVEGTGLGLAIVKHLVQAHGGEISAWSEIGTGSTFTFTIPLDHALADKGESTAAD
ncbi:MAG TPA: ATP-binding protein [Blastocatellia bacterium]|nr:ATP-binding protein [Blastocatellia bacterium]